MSAIPGGSNHALRVLGPGEHPSHADTVLGMETEPRHLLPLCGVQALCWSLPVSTQPTVHSASLQGMTLPIHCIKKEGPASVRVPLQPFPFSPHSLGPIPSLLRRYLRSWDTAADFRDHLPVIKTDDAGLMNDHFSYT